MLDNILDDNFLATIPPYLNQSVEGFAEGENKFKDWGFAK